MNAIYVLSMVFKTDLGKNYTIRLTGADPNVTDEEVKSAMQTVVDTGVIVHKNGTPADLYGATLIKTETEYIDVK